MIMRLLGLMLLCAALGGVGGCGAKRAPTDAELKHMEIIKELELEAAVKKIEEWTGMFLGIAIVGGAVWSFTFLGDKFGRVRVSQINATARTAEIQEVEKTKRYEIRRQMSFMRLITDLIKGLPAEDRKEATIAGFSAVVEMKKTSAGEAIGRGRTFEA